MSQYQNVAFKVVLVHLSKRVFKGCDVPPVTTCCCYLFKGFWYLLFLWFRAAEVELAGVAA